MSKVQLKIEELIPVHEHILKVDGISEELIHAISELELKGHNLDDIFYYLDKHNIKILNYTCNGKSTSSTPNCLSFNVSDVEFKE